MPRYGRGLGHQPRGASKRVRPDALLRGSMLVKGDSGVPVIAMPTPPWLARDTSRARSVLYLSLLCGKRVLSGGGARFFLSGDHVGVAAATR